MMEMLYILQYGGHWPHVLLSIWDVASVIKGLDFFYFI